MSNRSVSALVGLLALAATAALIRTALHTATGQRLDQAAMFALVSARGTETTLLSVLGRVSIGAIVTVMCLAVITALVRGQFALAVGAMAIIAGANVTTQVLKHRVLERPDFGFGTYPSLPSGHTTVVVAATAALVLVAPAIWRATVACVGSFASTMTALSTIPPDWHRPSDVIAACLVVLGWTAFVGLVVGGTRTRQVGVFVSAITGSIIAAIGLVAVGVRPLGGWSGIGEATLVMVAVSGTVAVSIWLMARIAPATSSQP